MSTTNTQSVDESMVTLLALAHRVLVDRIGIDDVRSILKAGVRALPADRLMNMPEYKEALRLVSHQ